MEVNYSVLNAASVAFKRTVLNYFANTKPASMRQKGPTHRVKVLPLYPLMETPPPHPLAHWVKALPLYPLLKTLPQHPLVPLARGWMTGKGASLPRNV